MVDRVMRLAPKSKIQILAPVIKDRKGEYKKEFNLFRSKGFIRVRVDGIMLDLADQIKLDKNKKHSIELVVDRLIIKDGIERRLADSIEIALRMADGVAHDTDPRACDKRP